MANIFHDVDEWLEEVIEGHSLTKRKDVIENGDPFTWVKEAWNQATLTARAQARVQLGLLQGELDTCYKKVKELEREIESPWENE
jgi:hypothetical protein